MSNSHNISKNSYLVRSHHGGKRSGYWVDDCSTLAGAYAIRDEHSLREGYEESQIYILYQ